MGYKSLFLTDAEAEALMPTPAQEAELLAEIRRRQLEASPELVKAGHGW